MLLCHGALSDLNAEVSPLFLSSLLPTQESQKTGIGCHAGLFCRRALCSGEGAQHLEVGWSFGSRFAYTWRSLHRSLKKWDDNIYLCFVNCYRSDTEVIQIPLKKEACSFVGYDAARAKTKQKLRLNFPSQVLLLLAAHFP